MKLHVTGRGDPILLANGIGADHASWGRFAELLAQHRTVITFDAPGCGDEPARWLPYTMRTLGVDVVEAMRQAGFGRFDVLGLSWGGALAGQIANDHPTRVSRLILASTTAGVGGVAPALHVTALAATPLRYMIPGAGKLLAPVLYGGGGGAFKSRPPKMLGYAHQLVAIASWLPCDRIQADTLIMHGDDDRLTPVGNAHVLHERITDSELLVVEGGGHLWLHNEPETAATAVVEWMESEARRSAA